MTPAITLAADVEQQLAHQSAATASAVIALTLAALIAVTAAVVLTLGRTTRSDDHAPVSHQRDRRGRGPASLDWVPDPHPRRTHGHLIPWMPDDPDETHFPLDPPAEPDYRAGDTR